MVLRIKAGLHFCTVEGRTIFLDEDESQYFCIPTVTEGAFRRFLLAEAQPCDKDVDAAIADLIALGILEDEDLDEGPLDRPVHIVEAKDDLGRGRVGANPTFEIVASFFERLRTNRIASRRGIADVRCLIDRERLRFADRRPASNPISLIAGAFEATDFLLGRNDRCLPRAIAMLRRCLRLGHQPSLVIGVRTNPFSAHCWVQQGVTIVGDSIEATRIYTPICVL